MEAELLGLIRKRGGISHKLTTFSKFIDKCLVASDIVDLVTQIQLRCVKAEPLLDEFYSIQESIECLASEQDLEGHYEYKETFENTYFEYIDRARNLITKNDLENTDDNRSSRENLETVSHANQSTPPSEHAVVIPDTAGSGITIPGTTVPSTTIPGTSATTSSSGITIPGTTVPSTTIPGTSTTTSSSGITIPGTTIPSTTIPGTSTTTSGAAVSGAIQGTNHNLQFHDSNLSSIHSSSLRLPTIDIPKFYGDYHSWVPFRDTFDGLVNRNESIPPILKFHYLRSALVGSASQYIQTMEFSAANYRIAWEELVKRYNNDRMLIHSHVKSLFELQIIKKDTHDHIRQLLDKTSKHLQSLRSLGEPVQHWDTLIIFIMCSKLDENTAREWEHHKGKLEQVKLDDLYTFMNIKANELEALSLREVSNKKSQPFQTKKCNFSTKAKSQLQCFVCKNKHLIYSCPEFLKLSVKARIDRVRQLNLCQNCLSKHKDPKCSRGGCKICNGGHNSLIHVDEPQVKEITSHAAQRSHVLLSTACVTVISPSGERTRARALLDSGSQSNFVTKRFCTLIEVPEVPARISIVGVNSIQSTIDRRCTIKLASNNSSFTRNISCHILDNITDDLPVTQIDISDWDIPSDISLADPSFFEVGPVDLLLGAGIFWDLLYKGRRNISKTNIVLQNTALGWVVSGSLPLATENVRCHFVKSDIEVQQQLERFWALENSTNRILLSSEEQACEDIFTETTRRDPDGRFIVKLPLKLNRELLGDSQNVALKRFQSLERKFATNKVLREMYSAFMAEYDQLGHMQRVDQKSLPDDCYYLCHHGVFKDSSLTTKLRVVFDGSVKTTSGFSINDLQMVGPTVQDDLISIFLRFRLHKYIVGADIKMMYRQILIDPEDRPLQLIFWRSDPTRELQTYILNTVTYGMTSSPYLATRCIKQLAMEAKERYPSAADTILSDIYIDDLLTGRNSVSELLTIVSQIKTILQAAGFPLHKWVSNCPELLTTLTSADPEGKSVQLGSGDHGQTKTLGLWWEFNDDYLHYSIKQFDATVLLTKRILLSDISQIWDPMGLVSPCIVQAKIILQKLWLLKLSWDDEIPDFLQIEYIELRQELSNLNDLKIPRRVLTDNAISMQLHGFADSSQEAYGASVYIRSMSQNGEVMTCLLCARSRVAPLKTQTIPRLELCAALLLAELADEVQKALKIHFSSVFLWSDSSIALHWIHTVPNKLQVFVANRVARIQELTKNDYWRHISTHHNPADIITRGASAASLLHNSLWWHGPDWLSKEQEFWPASILSFKSEPPELRKAAKLSVNLYSNNSESMFDRFSTLSKLKRVTAYLLRFIGNCKANVNDRIIGPLNVKELDSAMKLLIRCSQFESFKTELNLIEQDKQDQVKGPMKRLNPFLDSQGLIRVGGRLCNSQLPYSQKHPYVLSSKHSLTKLIFIDKHVNLLHAPPQLLLSSIRDTFWPIGGRSLARSIVYRCVTCFKSKPTSTGPQMGNLPRQRIEPSLPFTVSGTDYAGPILIRDRKGRGSKQIKCYVCLFICFSTKAIHLEAVTDLSTEGFMSCFKRFCSRRGLPAHLYSDNGTNYIGAKNEIQDLYKFLRENERSFQDKFALQGITWHLIPPHSPHFGGLWEAGVKTVKHHLKRVMRDALLTYEQFSTLLTQIEAVVNSRPLCPLTSDPNDFDALTPSHLLIGKKLISLPDPDHTLISENRLSMYQRLLALQQHFWKRWSKEYISELQERQRWFHKQDDLKKDMLVIVKDNNLPVFKWTLGRIIETFPGNDGIARVASVKTQNGVIKRAFSKLCPIPLEK